MAEWPVSLTILRAQNVKLDSHIHSRSFQLLHRCIPEWAPYNWDAMSWSDTRAYDAMLERHRVIVTEAYMLPNRDDEFEMQEHSETLAWFQDLIHPRDDPDQPASEILYPLLDTIDEISIEDPGKEKFVAMYALTFYWRSLMEDILPPNARGIVVVFSNPCNPTFTYRIDVSIWKSR